jgi:hypothetical protein
MRSSWPQRVLAVCAIIGAAEVAWALGNAVAQDSCKTVTGPGDSGVYINLDNERTPASVAHIIAAVEHGKPHILHWDPADSDAHRRAALKGVATAPGFDRDEYPPAASREGGAGADVLLIPAADNRSAGQRIGAVMSQYCAGQAFEFTP